MNTNLEQDIEFAQNPESRCPCVILVDTSSSMTGEPIAELNQGLHKLKTSLEQDELASKRVEVSIVSFNSTVTVEQDFLTPDALSATTLFATGSTRMGAGIEKALEMVESRKDQYRSNGISYYRPLIFLITDGAPTDDTSVATIRVHDGETNKRVAFFAIGVKHANMAKLDKISVRPARKLDELKFSELFLWISRSLQNIATSLPGDQVALPPAGWETL